MRHGVRRPGNLLVLCGLLLCLRGAGELRADEPLRADLQATADDTRLPWHERERAIRALADDFFDPSALVPWLRERLARETGFHLRLAFAFALASQGESDALAVLVDSLSETGHFGYIYLTELGGGAFGGPGKGWDKPSWDRWLAGLDPARWRELQRLRHLPRVPLDADDAGLERAVRWWDALGFPSLETLPIVRVLRSSWTDAFGFLLAEDAQGFTVLTTDLAERAYPRERRTRYGRERYRIVHVDLVGTVESALGLRPREAADGEDETMIEETDELGTALWPRRTVKGFVLARALLARGAAPLALKVWQALAEEPGPGHTYGGWSCLEQVKADAARASLLAWEEDARRPERSWAAAAQRFSLHRRRFDEAGVHAEAEQRLAAMALEELALEERDGSQGAFLGATIPRRHARRLVGALPGVARAFAEGHAGGLREPPGGPTPAASPDALDLLLELGYDAVPALQEALDDERPTRAWAEFWGFTRGWVRHDPRLVEVRDLARFAFHSLTGRDFEAPGAVGRTPWPQVVRAIDAWCDVWAERGERGVLEAGVLARDEVSGRDARLLMERYPEAALSTLRRALIGARPEVEGALLEALTPLASPESRQLLRERLRSGPFAARLAAARALFAQGEPEGLRLLLDDWPRLAGAEAPVWTFHDGLPGAPADRVDLGAFVEVLLELDPSTALDRLRATLGAASNEARGVILSQVPRALGYGAGGQPPPPGAPPVPAPVARAAEALVVALVLPPPSPTGGIADVLDLPRLGEDAAKTAAWLWPTRYAWDANRPDGAPPLPARTRLLRRFSIVNAWRATQGLNALPAPAFPDVPTVPPERAQARLEAWLAAPPGEGALPQADPEVLAEGLGMLPALRALRDRLPADDARRRACERLIGRIALLLRVVTWMPGSQPPSAGLADFLERSRGRPVDGRWIVDLLGAFVRGASEAATCLDVAVLRPGDDTGVQVCLSITSARADGGGNGDGWTLVSGGWEHVGSASLCGPANGWWRDARASEFDGRLRAAADAEVRARWTLTRVREP